MWTALPQLPRPFFPKTKHTLPTLAVVLFCVCSAYMPLTAVQKAERRARAAREAGRPYEARTPANQAVVASLEEEEQQEQHGVKRLAPLADAEPTPAPGAPLMKRFKGAFAKRESQKYQDRVYEAEYVPPPAPEDIVAVRAEQDVVRRHLVCLAAARCEYELPGPDTKHRGFAHCVVQYYVDEFGAKFRAREQEALSEHALEVGLAALEMLEADRRKREQDRQECLRLQAEKEREDRVFLTAEYCALDTLYPMNKGCEDCRLARKTTHVRRCEVHDAVYKALVGHYLKTGQPHSEVR